jgi:hypothetical protein
VAGPARRGGRGQGRVEHGDPDHDRSWSIGQGALDQAADLVGLQLGVENPATVPHQPFQVPGQATYPQVFDSHRGVMRIVDQSQRSDVIGVDSDTV